MTVSLSGPSAAPRSGGPARQLVIFLHGVGSNGADLIDLAPYLARSLPDAAFIAPDGPFAYDMAMFGRQWYSIRNPSLDSKIQGTRQAAEILNPFIDAQLAAHGLDDSQLAVVGFSQGTILGLHTMLRRPRACAIMVGFSGFLLDTETLADQLTAKPPVLLIHGDEDQVIPSARLGEAHDALAALGVPVIAHMRPGLGHSIDDAGLALAAHSLAKAFKVA